MILAMGIQTHIPPLVQDIPMFQENGIDTGVCVNNKPFKEHCTSNKMSASVL